MNSKLTGNLHNTLEKIREGFAIDSSLSLSLRLFEVVVRLQCSPSSN